MTHAHKAEQNPASGVRHAKPARRWLLFVHQLPSSPSNLRVRTWRRLQQLGAIPIKQAVYALPDTPDAREDFEWLKTEVKAAGGDASVFAADNVDAWSDDGLVEEFRRSRQEAYTTLARDIEKVLKRATSIRRPSGTRAPALRRLLDVFRERLTGIEQIDFFGSAGRDRVDNAHDAARGARIRAGTSPLRRRRLQGRAMPNGIRGDCGLLDHAPASIAWHRRGSFAGSSILRRGLDSPPIATPFRKMRLPFDMFGVEFSHQGDGCTFETLCRVFKIQEPAVARIAAIVHDLDLKDNRFGAPEAATVGHVIDGLQLAHADDDTLLAQGMALFDSLYRSFEHAARAAGPRRAGQRLERRSSARTAQALTASARDRSAQVWR